MMGAGTRAVLAVLALVLTSHAPARAQKQQTYPSRTIVLVIGLASGSVQDAAARIVAKRAGEFLRGQIIVDNKPGAAR